MSDLTVLVSPIPLYAGPSSSRSRSPFSSVASRRNRSPSPIMVTLESSESVASGSTAISESAARTAPFIDPGLLSPPINTWKSRPRHRPTRSQSAPPTQTSFVVPALADEQQPRRSIDDWRARPAPAGVPMSEPVPRQGRAPMRRSATSFGAAGYGYSTRGGELVRPPPPLLRPTTFWRKAHRSGVAAATYSPSAHLIRRSTYIAAGLAFDAPMHDLSALHVEARLHGEDGVRGGGPRVVEIPQAFELLGL
ncbi:hypothetical protein DFH08DRAFT_883598 [Mycena albidolilacea]|uniref:Uncharacterized protein n=1 Tax=Mycena albidolilacea TaxID=1033008 RepID=A0AAD6ZMQ4_9AGAR|nr:hypothetical protein DFH08DRAFT_883598 [Mycena albidolilacea]